MSTNNEIVLVGKVVSDATFSHTTQEENFYKFALEVLRPSGTIDTLPVTVPQKVLDGGVISKGNYVRVSGQLRSYNIHSDDRIHLVLSVFTRDIESAYGLTDTNNISLEGYLCQKPIYRITPMGKKISDILLAVNRPYNKSDYIPCIVWGCNAAFAGKLAVGDKLQAYGRLQSRNYHTQSENGSTITKTAYEVSASKLKLM